MTESEARGEGLADRQEDLDAFQTALHILVEDATEERLHSATIQLALTVEARSMYLRQSKGGAR